MLSCFSQGDKPDNTVPICHACILHIGMLSFLWGSCTDNFLLKGRDPFWSKGTFWRLKLKMSTGNKFCILHKPQKKELMMRKKLTQIVFLFLKNARAVHKSRYVIFENVRPPSPWYTQVTQAGYTQLLSPGFTMPNVITGKSFKCLFKRVA